MYDARLGRYNDLRHLDERFSARLAQETEREAQVWEPVDKDLVENIPGSGQNPG